MRPLSVLALALVLPACTPEEPGLDPDDPYDVVIGPYEVDIRWTSFGVPHIEAEDLGSAGYGLGYAFAQDHGCVLGDQLVKVRGERAKYLGDDSAWVDSDFGWKALDVVGQAERVFPRLADDVRAVFVGYAAGYNRWIEEGVLAPACDGLPWMKPITHIDVLAYALALNLDGSGAVFASDVGRAQPPGGVPAGPPPQGIGRLAEIGQLLKDPKRGSNGWAIGSERSADERAMLLSNTHFPAVGEKQWYELHLTVPGQVDVYGVSLMGVPVVNIGFNEDVAWTHTVSFAPRFVGYFLSLDPQDPTRYLYDGEYVDMSSKTYTIEVADGSGGTSTLSRTLFRSQYGPIFDAPIIGWSSSLAISYRDVNEDNPGIFEAWWRMNRADSLDALVDAQTETGGIPWVYTIAAGSDGEIFFGDLSRVPNLTPEALEAYRVSLVSGPNAFIASTFADFGVIGVDGSDPIYAWEDDPRAATPGIVPSEEAPTDRRRDYVFNANDSHWLHNVQQPLTGFPAELWGPERSPRSARTRMNGRYLSETGEGTASGADGRFDLDELEAAALSFRSSLVEEALDAVVARCADVDEVVLEPGRVVSVAEACDVLAAWDGRYTADARGAVLWRELLGSGEFDPATLNGDGGGLFAVPFDADDPLGTPHTVVAPTEGGPDADPVMRALALSVEALQDAGWDLDVALGEVQFMSFGDPAADTRIGVPGAGYWEGTIGIADYSGGATTTVLPRYTRPEVLNSTTERTADGYPVNNGNSFLMAMSFTDAGPVARAVMTYSQSEVWGDEHLHDQTALYAQGRMRPIRFTEADIAADVIDQLTLSLDVE